jgi:hypothetical protein
LKRCKLDDLGCRLTGAVEQAEVEERVGAVHDDGETIGAGSETVPERQLVVVADQVAGAPSARGRGTEGWVPFVVLREDLAVGGEQSNGDCVVLLERLLGSPEEGHGDDAARSEITHVVGQTRQRHAAL